MVLIGDAFRDYLERIRGANRWRSLGEKPKTCIRPSNSFCDEHWAVIEESQVSEDPIHSSTVSIGVSIWLYLNGYPPEEGCPYEVCCLMPEGAWTGILERARTNYWRDRLERAS